MLPVLEGLWGGTCTWWSPGGLKSLRKVLRGGGTSMGFRGCGLLLLCLLRFTTSGSGGCPAASTSSSWSQVFRDGATAAAVFLPNLRSRRVRGLRELSAPHSKASGALGRGRRGLHGGGLSVLAAAGLLEGPDPKVPVALWKAVGGSHAAQWITPVLEGVEEAGANVVSYTMNSCTFGDVGSMSQEFKPACEAWDEALLPALLADPPDLVVMVATRFVDGQEEFPEGYGTYIEALADAGIPVLGLRDNPTFPHKPPVCVEARGAKACQVLREQMCGPVGELGLLEVSSFTFVDLTDVYCPGEVCPVVQGDVLIYRDSAHLTATWVSENGFPVAEAARLALEG